MPPKTQGNASSVTDVNFLLSVTDLQTPKNTHRGEVI
jgi:hypothetical protein